MKVLLSAFSCAPGRGSEPGVGWSTLLAAASRHEVWLLTTEHHAGAIDRALRERDLADRVHVHAVPVGRSEDELVRFGLASFHWHYRGWQTRASAVAAGLQRRVGFDVAHHVTVAAWWAPVAVAGLGVPFVWGPVGGAVESPRQLVAELGARGVVTDGARVVGRRVLGALPSSRAVQRAASVVLAQNADTAARLRTPGRVVLLPNALAIEATIPERLPTRRRDDVVFVGRLIPLKGLRLAVRTLRHLRHDSAVLRVFGEGPEAAAARRLAQSWGVGDRLRLEGAVPRERLLAEVAGAGALLHPALHDEAPGSVAEALLLGTPVVCLDHGGPGELVRHWPSSPSAAVPAGAPEPTARALAAALDAFLDAPPPIVGAAVWPSRSYGETLLAAYDEAVAGATAAGTPTLGPARP